MAIVVPTVLAATPADYDERLQKAARLSKRIQIDICDGHFDDAATIGLAQIHAPAGVEVDLHLMLQEPVLQLETALSLHPHVIIFHAESNGDIAGAIGQVRELGVKAGVALLPETQPDTARELIEVADHVLIFTGTLGHNGGEFHPDQLAKAALIRSIKPDVEISVDGGVTSANVEAIVKAGVDVLYIGSFLHDAANPVEAYANILNQVKVAA